MQWVWLASHIFGSAKELESHTDETQKRRSKRGILIWTKQQRNIYLPGWGQWVINEAHGLGLWPPLHLGGVLA